MAAKKMDEMHGECCAEHKKKKGIMLFVLGILIVANAYWQVFDWAMFIGLIVAIAGIIKLVKPMHK